MSKSYKAINQNQRELGGNYAKASSEVMTAFMGLHKAAFKPGALEVAQKELIALGIGIAARCDGCIGAHVAAAIQAGATRQQLVETIDVAILMGGGPSVVYGTQALAAVDELLAG